MNRALDIDRPMAAVRTVLLPGCPRRSLNHGIVVLAVVASIAVSDAAFAQSSLHEPDAAAPGTTAPQAAEVSAWDAPEPWRTDRFFLATSVYTRHFNYNPAHDDHQNLIQGEWNVTGQWLAGVALFDNSFGQATQYVYGGYRFRPLEQLQPLYLKATAGLVHGYSGQYQNKIPFNNLGVAPVIIPSVGYCVNRFCSEAVFFGAAGVMVTIGVTVP